jgi:hypothetical protein
MTDVTILPDPFQPEALRLSQNFGTTAGVKKVLNVVPVRRPGRHDFVRVHPSEDYRVITAVIELSGERGETFLVAPHMRDYLGAEFVPVHLFTAITRQGTLFLWPCKVPGPDGRSNRWNESLLDAAERASTQWVRVVADMGLGAYQLYQAAGELSDPAWPDYPFAEILKVAFRDRLIDSGDHPVVRRLRGVE